MHVRPCVHNSNPKCQGYARYFGRSGRKIRRVGPARQTPRPARFARSAVEREHMPDVGVEIPDGRSAVVTMHFVRRCRVSIGRNGSGTPIARNAVRSASDPPRSDRTQRCQLPIVTNHPSHGRGGPRWTVPSTRSGTRELLPATTVERTATLGAGHAIAHVPFLPTRAEILSERP